jgi:hypothetical protein
MRLMITKIDPYGYNGRENPPSKSDEGLSVIPVKMESAHSSETGDWTEIIEGTTVDTHLARDEANLIRWWICVTEDGRILDLMEHEVGLMFTVAP